MKVKFIKESSLTDFFETIDVILCIMFLLSVIGIVLFFNLILYYEQIKDYCHHIFKNDNNEKNMISKNHNNNNINNKNNGNNNNYEVKDNEETFTKIVNCFDIKRNFYSLITDDPQSSKDSVLCLSGLKSLACIMIITQHLCFFTYFMSNNPVEISILLYENTLSKIVFQFVHAVEIFFVISAFLLTYNFLKNSRQMKNIQDGNFIDNIKFFIRFVLKRYFRLTPAILTTMVLSQITAVYVMKARPFMINRNFDLYCQP